MNERPTYDELAAAVAALQAREIKRSDLPMREIRQEVLLGEPIVPDESFVPHGIGPTLLSKEVVDQLEKVPDLDSRVTHLEQNPPTPAPPEPPHVVGAVGEPPYAAGWGSLVTAEPVAFYKHDGRVYLIGTAIRSSGTGTVVFTLPSGYRPPFVKSYIVSAGGTTTAMVAVQATGEVYVTGASGAYFDPVSFRIT